MTDWRFIEIDVIYAIHDHQIGRQGGSYAVRDASRIEFALAVPRGLVTQGKPDAAELAAAYAYWLAPGPEVLDLIFDRPSAHAHRFGISTGTIDQAVYDAFGSRIISNVFAPTGEVRVVLEVAPTTVEDIRNVLEAHSIPSGLAPTGQVSLSTLVRASKHSRPLSAFVDGNKRVAWEAARLFLADNGYTFAADPIDAIRKMEGVKARTVGEKEPAGWFRDRIQPIPR